jgi:hypothetical protein
MNHNLNFNSPWFSKGMGDLYNPLPPNVLHASVHLPMQLAPVTTKILSEIPDLL